MADPAIREASDEIQRLYDEYAPVSRQRNLNSETFINDGILKGLRMAMEVLKPKPLSPTTIINRTINMHSGKTIAASGIIDNDDEVSYCMLRCQIENELEREGYSFHYDGKPVQPKSSPVVDTGEDPKVQLAKQINGGR